MAKRKSRRSGTQRTFSKIPGPSVPRSVLNRSHGHKTTINAGDLIPIFVDEVLPGDTMTLKSSIFGRLATLIYPIMDTIYLDLHWFFVPNRLVWANWVRFMGERDNPNDNIEYEIPKINAGSEGAAELSLEDYFGIPTKIANLEYSALPFRAYNLIYNEWFRDQNLVNSTIVNPLDGPDPTSNYKILKRAKTHDYFTSALPWPQKGDPVMLPIGGQAPITWQDPIATVTGDGGSPRWTVNGSALRLSGQQGNANAEWENGPVGGGSQFAVWQTAALQADLNTATGFANLGESTAITVNALRESFQIQRLLERDARGGTRYVELLRSHYGVISPDFRQMRPEYLGGSSVPVNINTVPNTGPSENQRNQAELAAYGTANQQGRGFRYSSTEHGFIIGLVSMRAELTYQQGLERFWSRKTRYDHYWPAFANLGEQTIKNVEIFAQADQTANDGNFGYQERWAEYRYKPARISGKFRSNSTGPLHAWHLAQEFQNLPVLGETFITEDPPIARVVAVQNEPNMILDCYFKYECARPMPTYSVPGMIDHF